MNLKHAVTPLILGSALLAVAPLQAQDSEAEAFLEKNLDFVKARATIQGCTNAGTTGQAILVERPSDEGVKLVDMVLFMRGLTPGKHAVHIHEVGACTPCSA